MKESRVHTMGALIALTLLSFAVPTHQGSAAPLTYNDKLMIQQYILTYVRNEYVDSLGASDLLDGAIEGMIDKLDPHSSYMPPDQATDFAERIQGGFAGIGVTFILVDNKITVIDVVEGGPSEAAGLKSRDKIIQIDGQDVKVLVPDGSREKLQETIKEKLRGDPGSKVTVLIERPGRPTPVKTVITRNWVEMNSVSHAYMLDRTTGYIALTRFSVNTKSDVEKALDRLKGKGMERCVLDLRNNSGGVLDAAVGVVNLFINEGKIVYTLGRKKSGNYTWNASGKAPYADLPLIIMANHGSASASEIVTGALQDHDRALIVGQTTFGKGLVMNPIRLTAPDPANNGKNVPLGTLMLSVSRYYTPSGRLIQRPYTGSREEYIKEGFDDVDPNAADSSKAGKPVFHTDLGRNVYGGGGITPDITLPPLEKLNALERTLRSSNFCFEFADQYLLRHTDVPGDFAAFLTGYRIPADEIEKFRGFIQSKGVALDSLSSFGNELKKLFAKYDIPDTAQKQVETELTKANLNPDANLFEHSLPFIERELKQEIARMIWGTEQRYRVWHVDDTELIAAVAHFDQAKQMLTNRLALKKE